MSTMERRQKMRAKKTRPVIKIILIIAKELYQRSPKHPRVQKAKNL